MAWPRLRFAGVVYRSQRHSSGPDARKRFTGAQITDCIPAADGFVPTPQPSVAGRKSAGHHGLSIGRSRSGGRRTGDRADRWWRVARSYCTAGRLTMRRRRGRGFLVKRSSTGNHGEMKGYRSYCVEDRPITPHASVTSAPAGGSHAIGDEEAP